jgi:hypothetical protein
MHRGIMASSQWLARPRWLVALARARERSRARAHMHARAGRSRVAGRDVRRDERERAGTGRRHAHADARGSLCWGMPVENRKQASDGAKQADDAKSDGAGKQGSKYARTRLL